MGRPRKLPALRTEAVARVRTGEPVDRVANALGVDWHTVQAWVRAATPSNSEQKGYDYNRQFAGHLEQALDTLTAQLRLVGEPDWIRQQNARDLAILYGVVHDKAMTVYAAWERAARAQAADARPAADLPG